MNTHERVRKEIDRKELVGKLKARDQEEIDVSTARVRKSSRSPIRLRDDK